jgi:hypothetical protein
LAWAGGEGRIIDDLDFEPDRPRGLMHGVIEFLRRFV